MRQGRAGARAAARKDVGSAGSDNGSAGCSPDNASSMSARSSTVRAMGPLADRVRSILALGVRATRPMLGRMPTMPQKLAGLRSNPPKSVPCAIHAIPVASATAAPPDEPAAKHDRLHGLRVSPNTSLNVLAPAPNSGVL